MVMCIDSCRTVRMCSTSVSVESVMRHYVFFVLCFFFQAEDGIRDLVRSRGLGDVYKRQGVDGRDELARQRLERVAHVGRRHCIAIGEARLRLSLIHI